MKSSRLVLGLVPVCLLVAFAGLRQSAPGNAAEAYPPVTDDRLRNAASDDGWLMFMRAYTGEGHAPFSQINTSNVAELREVFTHDVSIPHGYEAPPIVNGRTMIVTTPMDHVYALDAVTGRKLWEYDYNVPRVQLRTICCDVVNRGVALYGTNAYIATLDNHVVALDARTGAVQWDKQIYPLPGHGYAMTLAPLAVEGKIIVGESGGEFGIRGFIVALDAATGAEKWRRYTIPGPGEANFGTYPGKMYEHGGGGAWVTGTYDVETRTLLWGVGNPAPWLAKLRPGRNLYSDSVIALDIDTGRVKWYFQQTPNDSWDYDATNSPVLADVTIAGRKRKVFYQAARNGWFYVVDRTNGAFISMTPFTKVTSVTGYDRARRIGLTNDSLRPAAGQTKFTCPAFFGGDNWYPYSFDPQTGYAYVPTMHTCMKISGIKPVKLQPGLTWLDETFLNEPVPGNKYWGELQAIDVASGRKIWGMKTVMPWNGGTISTDGGLVFSGTPDQKFYAFDARTGKVLWVHRMSSGIIGVPSTYRVDGKQYVAIQTGWGGNTPLSGGPSMTPLFRHIPLGGRLYVFALPDAAGGR